MTHEPKTIHVPEESELARVLEEVNETPLRLETRGVLYRVSREDEDLWTRYDPDAARASMAGDQSQVPVDAERAIARYQLPPARFSAARTRKKAAHR